MFGDLDWPPNASRRFVSISWASCYTNCEWLHQCRQAVGDNRNSSSASLSDVIHFGNVPSERNHIRTKAFFDLIERKISFWRAFILTGYSFWREFVLVLLTGPLINATRFLLCNLFRFYGCCFDFYWLVELVDGDYILISGK